jgi:glycosyltransferase involved in cell wall biosynthesis
MCSDKPEPDLKGECLLARAADIDSPEGITAAQAASQSFSKQGAPRHVLELIYSFDIGGSERLAVSLAAELLKSGIRASICAAYGGEGPIAKQAEADGVDTFTLHAERGPRMAMWRLWRLLKKYDVDVIHAHHVPQFILSYWPAKVAGIKRMVLTEHAKYSLSVRPRLNRLARSYSPRAGLVTTVYDGLSDFFVRELGVAREKVVTIPNGVDTAKFKEQPRDPGFRASLALGETTCLIGCIGRLVEAKDHRNLLAAMALLKKRNTKNIALTIVGDGPLRTDIEEQVRIFDLQQSVRLLGYRADIPYLLNNVDIVVLSSKREGFPMAVLEAMAAGTPCIATDVGGVRQVIDGENGVMVAPECPEALADAIEKLCASPVLRDEMGRLARRAVVERFDLTDILRRYGEVLKGAA